MTRQQFDLLSNTLLLWDMLSRKYFAYSTSWTLNSIQLEWRELWNDNQQRMLTKQLLDDQRHWLSLDDALLHMLGWWWPSLQQKMVRCIQERRDKEELFQKKKKVFQLHFSSSFRMSPRIFHWFNWNVKNRITFGIDVFKWAAIWFKCKYKNTLLSFSYTIWFWTKMFKYASCGMFHKNFPEWNKAIHAFQAC